MNNVPKGTPLKLRVIDAVTEEVLDTRENLVMDSCDAPVSVSETSEDVPFSITSISPNPATSVVRLSIGSTDASVDPMLRRTTLVAGFGEIDVIENGTSSDVSLTDTGASHESMTKFSRVSRTSSVTASITRSFNGVPFGTLFIFTLRLKICHCDVSVSYTHLTLPTSDLV